MRFFSIAMFIFCAVIATSWLEQVNIIGAPENTTYVDFSTHPEISMESLNESARQASANYTKPEGFLETTSQWGDFFTGMSRFIMAIKDATIGVPLFLVSFGFPVWMANDLSIIIWFIYAAGIIQFLSNRGFFHYR